MSRRKSSSGCRTRGAFVSLEVSATCCAFNNAGGIGTRKRPAISTANEEIFMLFSGKTTMVTGARNASTHSTFFSCNLLVHFRSPVFKSIDHVFTGHANNAFLAGDYGVDFGD